jgi:NAD(P)-dependent dehydrogenase (short-subunit alcohol dehydrogenase family)/3-oxoacyl-(acyl-carrier-protein) synthase
MPVTFDFSNKIVLVTGGGRGIGATIVRQFANAGAHTIINCFHSQPAAEDLRAEILEAGGSAEVIRASVGRHDDVRRMFELIADRHGALDVLINNAASGGIAPMSELSDVHWERAWDTNVMGALWCATEARPLMTARPGAAIVNLTSNGAHRVIPGYSVVGVTKAALESLTRYLATEFGAAGIRVNAASMDAVPSEALDRIVDESTGMPWIPVDRLATAEEYAQLVAYLASDAGSYFTGSVVRCDGGVSLPLGVPKTVTQPEPTDDGDAIAVVGMGVVTPGANSPADLWDLLQTGQHVLTTPSQYDVDLFYGNVDGVYSKAFGGIHDFRPHPGLAGEMAEGDWPAAPDVDVMATWLRHAAMQALDGPTIAPDARWLCAIGAPTAGSVRPEEALVGAGYAALVGADSWSGEVAANVLANRYRPAWGEHNSTPPALIGQALRGLVPASHELIALDSACSTGLYAIDIAMTALRERSCDVAVAGCIFTSTPMLAVLLSKMSALSERGEIHTFDRDADGTVFAEGAGVVTLKRLDDARRDGDVIHAVLAGCAVGSDGKGKSICAPNSDGQRRVIEDAWQRAGVTADDLDWIVAHGTGTPAGDEVEVGTLAALVGPGLDACALTSNKPIVGHTGGVAGIVSLINVVYGLRHETIPRQPYLRDQRVRLDPVHTRLAIPEADRAWPRRPDRARTATVSAFGFGGTNGHLVITEDHPRRLKPAPLSLHNDDIVLVDWAAHVPDGMAPDAVLAWLTGAGPAPPREFGADYPIPSPAELRLPPVASKHFDRSQFMVAGATTVLKARLGPAWTALGQHASVIVANMSPIREWHRAGLRCYLRDMTTTLAGSHLLADTEVADALAERVRSEILPITDETCPGCMPNLVSGRIANYFDARGPNLNIDTGPSSGLTALRLAMRQLIHGTTPLALVYGVSANVTPESMAYLPGGTRWAEGAIVLALTRRAIAQEQGLPVLATVGYEPVAAGEASKPLFADRSYLAADSLLSVVAASHQLSPSRIGAVDSTTPAIVITPQPVADIEPAPISSLELMTALDSGPVRDGMPAFPPETLVLTDDEALATIARRAGAALQMSDQKTPKHLRILVRMPAQVRAATELNDRMFATLQAMLATPDHPLSVITLIVGGLQERRPAPLAGIFTGLGKTAALEIPGCWCATILTEDVADLDAIDLMASESRLSQPATVVGYQRGERLTYALSPVATTDPRLLTDVLSAEPVIVATGGAGGITTEILSGLSRRVRPHLYLIGRSAPALAGALPSRAEFLRAARLTAPDAAVASLNADYDRLHRESVLGANLDAMRRAAGAERVTYLRCDVTDAQAVSAALAPVLDRHGRVDLLIHAAGAVSPAALATKSLADFRRIRDVKLHGYLSLKAALASHPPRIWCNFGSISALAGSPGDADYVAGNDFLNHSARFPTDGTVELSINWPAWRDVGMAADPLIASRLARRGYEPRLATADGVSQFLDVLSLRAARPVVSVLSPAEINALAESGLSTRVTRSVTLDLDVARWLAHHVVGGRATLPGTFMIELAAQAASTLRPDLRVVGVRRLTCRSAISIRPDARSVAVRVEASIAAPTVGGITTVNVAVFSDIATADGTVVRRHLRHSLDVLLAADFPAVQRLQLPATTGAAPADPLSEPDAWVSSSGPFRVIDRPMWTPDGAMAAYVFDEAWRPDFATYRMPWLLLDALTRMNLYRSGGSMAAATLTGIDEIDLYSPRNDTDLGRVSLIADRSRLLAVTPDGSVAVAMSGVTGSPV